MSYNCVRCDKIFTKRKSLVNHLNKNTCKFDCQYCEKKLSSFTCPYCDKKFKNDVKLNDHIIDCKYFEYEEYAYNRAVSKYIDYIDILDEDESLHAMIEKTHPGKLAELIKIHELTFLRFKLRHYLNHVENRVKYYLKNNIEKHIIDNVKIPKLTQKFPQLKYTLIIFIFEGHDILFLKFNLSDEWEIHERDTSKYDNDE